MAESKPSALKAPQIKLPQSILNGRVNKNENNIQRPVVNPPRKLFAHEAPSVPTVSRPPMGLRRRSKSVTDLASLTNCKRILGKQLLPPTMRNARTNQAAAARKAPPIINECPNNDLKTGKKRPLDTKSDDGMPKLKLFKKVPDWDYKTRFNQMNENYQVLQEFAKSVTTKISKNAFLETKCQELQREADSQLEKRNYYEKQYSECSSQLKTLQGVHDELRTSNTELTKKCSQLIEQNNQLEEKLRKVLNEQENFVSKLEYKNKECDELKTILSEFKARIIDFDQQRKMLHNTIQDLKGNIRVFCRIRPRLTSETNKVTCQINVYNENSMEIRRSQEQMNQITGKSHDSKMDFTFDKVFDEDIGQEEVFEELAHLIQSALDGYDVCVFAYGQTGSGKTHTMVGGQEEKRGMIPRSVNHIFATIERLQQYGWQYKVHASFLEIYNESIRDLLNINSKQKLDICFNEGKGTTVTNLTRQKVESAPELEHCMTLAHRNRATAATNFNEHSSRSHAVTKIYIDGCLAEENIKYSSCINLVDLAGSERATQSNGERLTETKNINKSLATLGDVMSALHNKSRHVPYRNSKLTYLLQSSLGGNSKTLMIVNISPMEDCFGESLSSLRFAAKVKEVKTNSKKNKMRLSPIPT